VTKYRRRRCRPLEEWASRGSSRWLPLASASLCLFVACHRTETPSLEPVRLAETATVPVTFGGETRRSLAGPVPSEMRFELQVPEDGALEIATGVQVAENTVLPARVEFKVVVRSGEERETVLAHTIRRFEPNTWFDHEVDLGGWAGEPIELGLEVAALPLRGETAPPADLDGVTALWANPLLFSRQAPKRRPDIFLITIDCLRSDHVGAYGYERETTPSIDRFAKDGVLFETTVASAPETLPSHMTMLTGLTPLLHGASKRSRLPQSIPYLPELLAGNGYEVDGIVNGAFLSQAFGFERGFHSYRFLDVPRAAPTIDAGIEWLRRGRGRSQFLWLHLFEPHWPYLPESELIEKFGPRPADISKLMHKVSNQDVAPDGPEEVQEVENLYDAEVFATDRALGRFFSELRSRGLYDSSLIIVVADHGEAFYEHGLWQHTLSLYEEMIRIPLVVKWPGSSPIGRSKVPVHEVDLFSTILEAAGITPPPNEGRNLSGLLDPEQAETRVLWSEAGWASAGRYFRILSARNDEHKYIVSMEDDESKGWPPVSLSGEELYRWRVDAGERDDLSETDHEELDAFRKQLRAYLEQAAATRRGTTPEETIELDETTLEQLRALGYLK
jgi:arylsulfatase A-like enzyme